MALNSQGYPIWNVGNMNQKVYNTSDKKSIHNYDWDTLNDEIMSGNSMIIDTSKVGLDASKDRISKDTNFNDISISTTKDGFINVNKTGDTTVTKLTYPGIEQNSSNITGQGVVYTTDENGNIVKVNDKKPDSISQYEEKSDTVSGAVITKDGDNYYINGVQFSSNWNNSKNLNYTQDIETSTEEPQPKSYEDGYNQAKKYAQLLNDINNKTEDIINKSKEFAEKDLKKYNSGMRVSLNISPINRYIANSNITTTAYNNRAKYILGEDGLLKTLFGPTNGLIFPYTPQINMQHNVNYEDVEILHSNLTYQYYKNTPPPPITISADFTADTPENALYMLGAIWFFRSMTKSDFGKKANRGEKQNYAGMPPPVLYLNGYGKMYDNIPVIIKSFDTPFQKDKHYVRVKIDRDNYTIIDYQHQADGDIFNYMDNLLYDQWLPTEMTMQITLAIQPNLKKAKDQFDLNEYKRGILGNVIKNGNTNIDGTSIYSGAGWTW